MREREEGRGRGRELYPILWCIWQEVGQQWDSRDQGRRAPTCTCWRDHRRALGGSVLYIIEGSKKKEEDEKREGRRREGENERTRGEEECGGEGRGERIGEKDTLHVQPVIRIVPNRFDAHVIWCYIIKY